MSLSSLLNISKQAMLAHQSAINTTANNIANVNTLGYRRRRVDLAKMTSASSYLGFGQLNGVYSTDQATLIRQRFVESQLRYEYQQNSQYQSDELLLTQVENIFGEPGDSGLANVMAEFWNSWSDLANDPESQTARTLVADKGELLSNTFNRVHSDLVNLQEEIGSDVISKVDEINRLVVQLGELNEKISGNLSDDLMDERDVLLNDLSKLMNIDVSENSNGMVTVATNGNILVASNYVNELTTDIESGDGTVTIKVGLVDGANEITVASGELGSLLDISRNEIPEYLNQLNYMARELAERVNAVHSSGYSLTGVTGLSFFSEEVTGAADIHINSAISDDPSNIASSGALDTPGDGSIAQALADIQNETFMMNGTAGDFYQSIVSQIGSSLQEASFLRSSQELVVTSMENQRDSVSGVSLDEEMTMLIEFERGYEAAAQLISTVDELMSTVINMV